MRLIRRKLMEKREREREGWKGSDSKWNNATGARKCWLHVQFVELFFFPRVEKEVHMLVQMWWLKL